jgi:hypothetical protein
MRTIEFRVAGAGDDPELRRLLRDNPMAGAIEVSLEREPNAFLAGAVEGDRHHAIVARDGACDRAVGMASRSVYTGFVNGRPCPVGYLGQLRLDREYRGRPRLLAQGFALLGSLRDRHDLPYDLTSIVADNTVARRVLGARLPGLPEYRELETFTTLILPVWRARRARIVGSFQVRTAAAEDLDGIAACLARNRARYQFARCWSADDLRSPAISRGLAPEDFVLAIRGGRIVGCLALWDQSGFKQIVVRGYGRPMRWVRAGLGVAARMLAAPRLPDPGQPLSHAYLSHVAIDDDQPEVFGALCRAAYECARRRRIACVIAGFAARHPLLAMLRRDYGAFAYTSQLYTVHWPNAGRSAAAPDGRMAHPEVAVL